MRFSATALDLSRVDRTVLWPGYSFEQIRAERIADLKERLTAAGVPYDVGTIEGSPGAMLQQASGYRELLTKQAIDDAQAAVLLAFATGPFLDRLGDMWGTARLEGETDTRYRTRIQLAPEAFAGAGTPGGYIYHAASVSTDVRDVGLQVLNRGTPDVIVELTILSAVGDGTPSTDLINAVRSRIYSDEVKLLTDVIIVRPAVILHYDVRGTLAFRSGPDPGMIKSQATAKVRLVADQYKRIGADIPSSALSAALYVPNVDRVDLESPSDVVTRTYQAAHLDDVDLKMVVVDD